MIAEGERNDRILAERDLLKARREAQGLRAQLSRSRKDDPGAKQVRDVLDYWQPLMPRAKTPLDGVRADAVRKALASHTPAELKEAIEGAHKLPYVWKDRQRMPFGTSTQRFVDITLVLRDERTIERFRSYARDHQDAGGVFVVVPQSAIDRMQRRVLRCEWAWRLYREIADEERGITRLLWDHVERLEGLVHSGQTRLRFDSDEREAA